MFGSLKPWSFQSHRRLYEVDRRDEKGVVRRGLYTKFEIKKFEKDVDKVRCEVLKSENFRNNIFGLK